MKAVNTACCLINRFPSTAIECKTPEEVWLGSPTDYINLRIFGCPAYAHANDGKLEPRVRKCIFLGYAHGVKRYRLCCLDGKSTKCIISRDVTFDESAMLKLKKESFDARTDYGVSKRVELEVETTKNLQDKLQVDFPIQRDVDEMQGSNEENAVPQEYKLTQTEKRDKLSNLKDMGMKILLPMLIIQLRVLRQSRLHIMMSSLVRDQQNGL